jgi:hypothetical protein
MGTKVLVPGDVIHSDGTVKRDGVIVTEAASLGAEVAELIHTPMWTHGVVEFYDHVESGSLDLRLMLYGDVPDDTGKILVGMERGHWSYGFPGQEA